MISKMVNSTVSHRFRTKKGKEQEDLQKEIECDEYAISTYGEDTEERIGAYAKLEELNR